MVQRNVEKVMAYAKWSWNANIAKEEFAGEKRLKEMGNQK